MRDDNFKGGSFGQHDRRLLRACAAGEDQDIRDAARYALSAEFSRQVGDCLQRLGPAMVGAPWMVAAALDDESRTEASPGACKLIELVRANVADDEPPEKAIQYATRQMLCDDVEARANKMRHYAGTLEGPRAKAARAQARRAEAALRAAASDPALSDSLVRGEAFARPKKRPVTIDEVIE